MCSVMVVDLHWPGQYGLIANESPIRETALAELARGRLIPTGCSMICRGVLPFVSCSARPAM